MGKHPRKNSKKQEGLIIQKTEKIFYIVATVKAGVKKDKWLQEKENSNLFFLLLLQRHLNIPPEKVSEACAKRNFPV